MSSRVPQILLEQIREALTTLGVSGGGGPDLSVPVAQLQADVAALQAAVTQLQTDTAGLQADVDTHSDFIGNALFTVARGWIAWDTSAGILAASGAITGVADNGGPGLFRVTFGDLLDTTYCVVVGGQGDTVKEVARTSTTLDLDVGSATLASVAIFSATIAPS